MVGGVSERGADTQGSGAPAMARRWAMGALRHLPFGLVLVAGIVLRVIVWSAYRPAILLLGDTNAYLNAAGGDPHGAEWHPLLYAAFLKPAFALGSLGVATALQHLLILGVAVGLYIALMRIGVRPVLGALGVAPLLLDAYQLNLEQQILTEALFETLLAVAVILLVWWSKAPWWFYAFPGAFIGLSVGTRYAGLALLPVAIIYLLIRRVGWLPVVSVIVGFAMGLGGYLSWKHTMTGTYALTSRGGYVMYGKVATFADCTGVDLPEVEQQLCIDVPAEERAPSYNMWNKESPLRTFEVPPGADENEILDRFNGRFIRRQPLDYAQAVVKDLLRFFAWRTPEEQERIRVQRWQFFTDIDEVKGVSPAFRKTGGSPPPELGLDETFEVDTDQAQALIDYQGIVYPSGPLMTIMALLGLVGCVLKRSRPDGRDSRPEAALFLLAGIAVLAFPATFAAYHFRYVLPALPLLGPGAAIGAMALSDRIVTAYGRSRSSDEAADAPATTPQASAPRSS